MGGALTGSFGRCELGTEVVTIGRAPTNKLMISDGQVSGRHAEVRPDGVGYVLVDVGSTNGTLLNGTKIAPQAPQPVRGGDVITIGSFKISVELAAGELPATIRATPPNEGAYAPTERVGVPPVGGVGGAAYAGTSYVPPPPPPPDFPPLAPGGPGMPPPTAFPDSYNQYGGGSPGGAAPYYPDPYAASPPPPVYTPPYAGPPGMGLGAPGGVPAANRTRLYLIIGAVLAGVLIIVTIGVVLYNTSHSPSAASKSFYSAVQSQDYATAYTYFTPDLQQSWDGIAQANSLPGGEAAFQRVYQCFDKQFGTVTGTSFNEVSKGDTQATVQVAVTRANANYTDEETLKQLSGDWKIDAIHFPPNQQCIS